MDGYRLEPATQCEERVNQIASVGAHGIPTRARPLRLVRFDSRGLQIVGGHEQRAVYVMRRVEQVTGLGMGRCLLRRGQAAEREGDLLRATRYFASGSAFRSQPRLPAAPRAARP